MQLSQTDVESGQDFSPSERPFSERNKQLSHTQKQKGQTTGTTGKNILLQSVPTKALLNAHKTLVHILRRFPSNLIDDENESLDTFSRRVRICRQANKDQSRRPTPALDVFARLTPCRRRNPPPRQPWRPPWPPQQRGRRWKQRQRGQQRQRPRGWRGTP